LNDLRYQMTKATFNNWLGNSNILTTASSPVFLVVVVRNVYAWEWLTYRLHPVVTRTVIGIAGDRVSICFIPRTSTMPENNDESVRRPLARISFDSAQSLHRTARLSGVSSLLRTELVEVSRRLPKSRPGNKNGVPLRTKTLK
jgi:chromosomal replication initiation ATPase DnaA